MRNAFNSALSCIKRNSKVFLVTAISVMMAMLACFNCFAADGDTNLTSTFTTAIDSIKGDILNYLGIALVAGLAVTGAVIAIKKGISFVKSVVGKG